MIEDDMLIRETPVYDGQNCVGTRIKCIITKEEFLACFNEWVVKPSQENAASTQTPFGIPVDNNGVTPV